MTELDHFFLNAVRDLLGMSPIERPAPAGQARKGDSLRARRKELARRNGVGTGGADDRRRERQSNFHEGAWYDRAQRGRL